MTSLKYFTIKNEKKKNTAPLATSYTTHWFSPFVLSSVFLVERVLSLFLAVEMAFSNGALLTSFMKVTTKCSWTLFWYRSACLLLLRPLLCTSFVPTETVLREPPGPHSHSFDPILGLLIWIYFQTSVPVSSFPIYPLNHCQINVSQTLCWSLA